jgi:hypothetical protein
LWPLLLLSAGCAFISDDRELKRLDPDGDGVFWPDDCDDADIHVGRAILGFVDEDGDGWGAGPKRAVCPALGVAVQQSGDCDDADPDRRPDAAERCDSIDNNCDGNVDEGLMAEFYPDADGDEFGDSTQVSVSACTPPDGYAQQGGDCDDTDAGRNPAAAEVCNDGMDDDCNGLADDDDDSLDPEGAQTWYVDGDGDGFGDPDAPIYGCVQPPGVVNNDRDCEDTSTLAGPHVADETCGDRMDNDCDGLDGLTEGCSGDYWADLADADRRFTSAGIDDELGAAIAGGIDLNGDRLIEVALGAPGDDRYATNSGVVFLVSEPHNAATDLSDSPVLIGARSGDRFGAAIAALPKVDSNAYDALLVGAPYSDLAAPGGGAAWVVRGPVTGAQAVDEVAMVQLSLGLAQARVGAAVASIGDQDGDGISELLVSGPGWSDTQTGSGAVWVVSGTLEGDVDLGDSTLQVYGEEANASAGSAVSTGGDINGDGIEDLLVGAPQSGSAGDHAGAAFLLLGPITTDRSLTSADETLYGLAPGDFAGQAVAGGGDLNGDGLDDIAIGAPRSDHAVGEGGAAYVLFGPGTDWSNLDEASARLDGADQDGWAGQDIAIVDDIDSDGTSDLVIGAPGRDDTADQQGAAWLVLMRPDGVHSLATSGALLVGESARDRAGTVVASAGDADGDGTDDVLVGAPARPTGPYPDGAVYLVLSGPGL